MITHPTIHRALHNIAQAEIDRIRRHAAPPPHKLQEFAKRPVGKILGCNSVKVAGGLFIGIGIAGLIVGTGGIAFAVGLAAIGLTIWLGSTTLSLSALHNKDYVEKATHVVWSLAIGVAGFFAGALGIGGAGAGLAMVIPKLVHFGNGFQMVSALAGVLDMGRVVSPDRADNADTAWRPEPGESERRQENVTIPAWMQVTEYWPGTVMIGVPDDTIELPDDWLDVPRGWSTRPLPPEEAIPASSSVVIASLNSKLVASFDENSSDAIVCQSSGGQSVILHMDNGEDYIAAEPVAGSDLEWIAVMRQASPAIYDVIQLSTYERLMTDGIKVRRSVAPEKHPTTRIDMSDDRTIRGLELIALLDNPLVESAPEIHSEFVVEPASPAPTVAFPPETTQ